MAGAGDRGRALSFGAVAEDYHRYRPGPPAEAVEWVLAGRRGLVVELGAGTGGLTARLVSRTGDVVAVEPDRRMHAVLASRVEGARVVTGRAEELPLVAGCADAVVGSSMWHWVDEALGPVEVARVLRPGGVLGLLWSGPDRTVDWVAGLQAVAGTPSTPAEEERRRRRRHVRLAPDAPFESPETRVVGWTLDVTCDELVGLLCTYSRFIVLPEGDRRRRRDQLAAAVAAHPLLAGRAEVELPMRCACWRAVRTR